MAVTRPSIATLNPVALRQFSRISIPPTRPFAFGGRARWAPASTQIGPQIDPWIDPVDPTGNPDDDIGTAVNGDGSQVDGLVDADGGDDRGDGGDGGYGVDDGEIGSDLSVDGPGGYLP